MKKIVETIKHKWAEYLLEIIVIMVGILGAFGLNNWNEGRKDRVTEKEILHNVVDNLEANLQMLDSYIALNELCDRSSAVILSALENKITYSDTLDQHFGWGLTVDPGTRLSFVGYEAMKNAGLEMVSNKSLKKEIINLFEETYQEFLLRNDNVRLLRVEITKLRQERFLRGSGFSFSPFDFDSLLRDKFFYSWLHTIIDTRSWINYSIKQSHSETQRVLQLLKDELHEIE